VTDLINRAVNIIICMFSAAVRYNTADKMYI